MKTPAQLRAEVVRYANALHGRGWVANHDGNVTARLSDDRFIATPTAVSKGDVVDSWLIVVDETGKRVSGERRSFSEFAMHRAAYEARADVSAVIHAHPPNATAFSVIGRGLERPILAEAVVSIGPRVPLAPFALPGSEGALDELQRLLAVYDVVILENHGVLTVGPTLEHAYLRMELVEHLARIERLALQMGTPRYLSQAEVQPLLDKRTKAGLGPEARGAADPDRAYSSADDQATLRRIIAQEIRAALED